MVRRLNHGLHQRSLYQVDVSNDMVLGLTSAHVKGIERVGKKELQKTMAHGARERNCRDFSWRVAMRLPMVGHKISGGVKSATNDVDGGWHKLSKGASWVRGVFEDYERIQGGIGATIYLPKNSNLL